MGYKRYRFGLISILLFSSFYCNAEGISIKNNVHDKVIIFGNDKMMITLDYNRKCNISDFNVNGQSVISGPAGVFSEIRTSKNKYSTLNLISVPTIQVRENIVTVSNIKYGSGEDMIIENWKFLITALT